MRSWTTLATVVLLSAAALSGCFSKSASDVAVEFVSKSPYSKIMIEIDYADGKKPRDSAVSLLEQRISERLEKPGGKSKDLKSFQPTTSAYSEDDLQALEKKLRNHGTGGDTIVLYVLYVNGHSTHDTPEGKVLGVKYADTSIAIFKETVDSSGGLIGGLNFNAEEMEKAVLVHEFGHAIGLVNLGLKMVTNHEDAEHPKHSNNKDSVMYWAIENTGGLPLLNSIPTNFDSNDIADIRAAGGK